jgi:hypothetical protein
MSKVSTSNIVAQRAFLNFVFLTYEVDPEFISRSAASLASSSRWPDYYTQVLLLHQSLLLHLPAKLVLQSTTSLSQEQRCLASLVSYRPMLAHRQRLVRQHTPVSHSAMSQLCLRTPATMILLLMNFGCLQQAGMVASR